MRLSDSGRGLIYTLQPDRRRFTVAFDVHEREPFATVEAASELDADGFSLACAEWSNATDDAELRSWRRELGMYPLVWSMPDSGDRVRVSVTVEAVGAAPGVNETAVAEAGTHGPGLVMVDRSEPRRTGAGIEYVFTFAPEGS